MRRALSFASLCSEALPGDWSAAAVIALSYRLLWTSRGTFAKAIALPACLATATLCVTLQSYYTLLSGFLAAPTARRASVLAAILIAGALVWLFLNVLVVSAAVRAAYGCLPARWYGTPLGAVEARLFAATLRLVLIFVCLLTGALFFAQVASSVLGSKAAIFGGAAIWGIAAAAILVLSIRCGFLLPVLALREPKTSLRHAWTLSCGLFWKLAYVWAALVGAPAVLIFVLGELALDGWIMSSVHTPSVSSVARAAAVLAAMNAGISVALILAVASTACCTLTGIGSTVIDRQINRPSS